MNKRKANAISRATDDAANAPVSQPTKKPRADTKSAEKAEKKSQKNTTKEGKENKIETVETPTVHLFYHGPFSQFHECKFVVDGVTYCAAEQYMMASKAKLFKDDETLAKIMAATKPSKHKALGRQVKPFDQATWDKHCHEAVFRGNLEKFSQNEELKKVLLATGDRTIGEAAPRDKRWGIGLATNDPRALDTNNWRGWNWLGIALMRVRDKLRSSSTSSASSSSSSSTAST